MVAALSRRTVFVLATLAFVAWAAWAQAAPVSFQVSLTGAQQVPEVKTDGKGAAVLTWDPSTRVVTWDITSGGLSGDITMAHFHNGALGKNGPVVIWLSKQGNPVMGSIKGEATLTSEQAQQFEAGDWYINVHTKDHPGGEIRGQVMPPKG